MLGVTVLPHLPLLRRSKLENETPTEVKLMEEIELLTDNTGNEFGVQK